MTDKFTQLSSDQVREKRKESLLHGYTYPLHTTSIEVGEDVVANVRRITLMDRAILDILPQDIQKVVWDGLQEYQREARKAQAAGDPTSLAEMVKNNSQILKAADAWCIASFVNPILIADENDRAAAVSRAQIDADSKNTDPVPVWHITDVAPEDRVAVMQACTDSSGEAARLLKKFRPESKAPARDHGTVPTRVDTPERLLEAEGGL